MIPRLVAVDLDGTFLDPAGAVTELNAAAVRRCAELGVLFVVATGRPSRWLDPLDGVSGCHPLAIVSNGAGIFDLAARTYVETFAIRPDDARAVAGRLRAALPGISFGVEWGTAYGREPLTPSGEAGLPWTATAALDELLDLPRPILKLLGYHRELNSDELLDLARPLAGDPLTLTHSAWDGLPGLLEMSAPRVTKASALAHLCASLGIPSAEVAAFGDMPNDVPMLSWAGQGYVVANAHPRLLAAGFRRVGSNADSGVGAALLSLLAKA